MLTIGLGLFVVFSLLSCTFTFNLYSQNSTYSIEQNATTVIYAADDFENLTFELDSSNSNDGDFSLSNVSASLNTKKNIILTGPVVPPIDDDPEPIDDSNSWTYKTKSDTYGGTWYSYKKTFGSVQGGAKICFVNSVEINGTTYSSPAIIVKNFNGSDDYNDFVRAVNIAKFGYETTGYEFYYKDNKVLTAEYKFAGASPTKKWVDGTNNEIASDGIQIENIVANYDPNNNQITVKPIVQPKKYDFALWYIDEQNPSITAEINLQSATSIENITATSDDATKSFGAWALDVSKLSSYTTTTTGNGPYTISVTNSPKTVDLTFTANKHLTDAQTIGDNNEYYYITSIQGYVSDGSFNNSYNNAIVFAKWSNTYEVTLQADSNDDRTNYSNIPLSLAGHKGTGNSPWATGTSVSFNIKDNSDYAYPFQTATYDNGEKGYAFMIKNDFENQGSNAPCSSSVGKYYVYKYGFVIVSWTLKFTADNQEYYVSIDNSNKWTKTTDPTSIDLAKLYAGDMTYLADFAEVVDDASIQNGGDAISAITLTPNWQEAGITVKNYVTNATTNITYDSVDYDIQNMATAPTGQSLACFATKEANGNNYGVDSNSIKVNNGEALNNQNIIVLWGNWNYVKLSANQFVYNSTDGSYTLNVLPVFVDNIYRINLANVPTFSTDTYELEGNTYSFRSSNVSTSKYVYTVLDDLSRPFITSVETIASLHQMDIEGFVARFAESGGYFKTVFTSDGTISNGGKTLEAENPTLWIYLANNQLTTMPVFKKTTKDLIYYYDDEKPDNGNHYAYLTSKFDPEVHGTINGSADNYTLNYTIDNKSGNFNLHTNSANVKWQLTDQYPDGVTGGQPYGESSAISLKANLFRKYYLLDVKTLVNNADLTSGAVHITITDTDETEQNKKDGEFYVYYNNGYKVYDQNNNTTENLTSDGITLYADCELLVEALDQSTLHSKEAVWLTGMIGFKAGTLTTNNATLNDKYHNDNTSLSFELNGVEISSLNLNTKDKIVITATYVPIEYELTVDFQNQNTGNFDFYRNTSKSANNTEHTLSPIKVVDTEANRTFSIVYNADIGFKFQSNEISLWINENELTFRVESETNDFATFYENEQKFVVGFNQTWLKNYFYTEGNGYDDYN